jgi:hypothetical protein
MLIDPTTARTSTRWIVPVFTSELFFLFRLPILLIPALPADMIDALVETQLSGARSRFDGGNRSEWWATIRSEQARRAALYTRPTLRKYINMVSIHTALAIIGLVLNIIWLAMWWAAISHVTPATSRADHSALRHYVDQTLEAITNTRLGHTGSWFLMVSVILYFVQYAHYRHHLVRLATHYPGHPDTLLPRYIYILAHFSVINYVFDIPDIDVPTTKLSRIIIMTINLVAGSILAVALIIEEPFTEAWGCYPPGTSYVDLDSGMCPRFLDNPQDVLPPVCTVPGAECGQEVVRWKHELSDSVHQAQMAVTIGVFVYLILTIDSRIRFYKESAMFLQAVSTPQKNKKEL